MTIDQRIDLYTASAVNEIHGRQTIDVNLSAHLVDAPLRKPPGAAGVKHSGWFLQ
jgi:hypothetical protein